MTTHQVCPEQPAFPVMMFPVDFHEAEAERNSEIHRYAESVHLLRRK